MKMELRLNAPGMTSLHKAGLAGLYLTLRAFEETGKRIKGLEWELSPTHVTLVWADGTLRSTLDTLIAKSFRLEDGFIVLAGLEIGKPARTRSEAPPQYRVVEQLSAIWSASADGSKTLADIRDRR